MTHELLPRRVDQVEKGNHAALGVRLFDDIRRDLRVGTRSLAASPIVTFAAILSLALVIGANTAIFSILNGLLLRPLPVRDPSRLVHVTDSVRRDDGETRVRAWAYPTWEQIRQRSHLFESATAWSFTRFNLAVGGEARLVEGIWADGGFFEMLGVSAALGRTFSARDDVRGGGPDGAVAVISHRYWQTAFGGADDILGRSVQLNGVPFTIVGVMPPEFFGVEVGRSFDFVVPLRTEAMMRGEDSVLDSAASNFLSILARLNPGQSLDAAAAELRHVQPEIRQATLGPWTKDVADRYLTSPFTLVPAATGFSNLRSTYERPLVIIAAIVALVLLIGCVNVTNLLLARGIGRRHEFSLRLALGASRARLVRQLLAEGLVLSAAGSALGVLIAAYGSAFLVRQLSTPTTSVFLDVSMDGGVLGFNVAVTVLTALLVGTGPAFRATRLQPMGAIKELGRTSSEPGSSGLMGWLVAVQVALSVVLVVAAGLFIGSFASLVNRPLGLDSDQVLVVTVDPQNKVPVGQRLALYERVRQAVAGLPNVASAAISILTPLGGGGFTPPVEVSAHSRSGEPRAPQVVPANQDVFGNLVSPGWFGTFGVRLLAGRDFAAGDRRGSPRAAIVNEAFVRRFFGGDSPLGQIVVVYPNTPRALPAEIVGVAADAVYTSPRDAVPPLWYLPLAQFDVPGFAFGTARLSVRAQDGSPELLTKSIASAVAHVNPDVSLTFRALDEQIGVSRRRERLMAQLAGFLGAIALLLAGIGLYGVTAYAVSRRRTELAIRMALGALPNRALTLVLTRVLLMVAAGAVAGTGTSIWASQFIAALMYGIEPKDPIVLVSSMATLGAVAGAAVWLAARRVARIDAAIVLREG